MSHRNIRALLAIACAIACAPAAIAEVSVLRDPATGRCLGTLRMFRPLDDAPQLLDAGARQRRSAADAEPRGRFLP